MRAILTILLLSVCAAVGAPNTYYVLIETGSDSDTGLTWDLAKRTISNAVSVASAGDTIYLGGGDFAEYVSIEATDHSINIISESNAVTRSFWVKTASNVFNGLTFSKCTESGWGAIPKNGIIRLDENASHTIITNCKFINQPWISSTNWKFNLDGNKAITNNSVDLLAIGFDDMAKIYVNGVSYSNTFRGGNWRFDNQSIAMVATNVTATSFEQCSGIVSESNTTNIWACIAAGTSPYEMNAIRFIQAGGYAASNVVISGCLFSNLLGVTINLVGSQLVVSNCEFTAIHGNSFMTFGGIDLLVASNFFHGCDQIAYYDTGDAVQHEGGPGFYDYYVASIKGSGDYTPGNSNFWFVGNWMQDIHTDLLDLPHSQPDPGDFRQYHVIGNVFVGCGGDLGGGGDYTYVNSNTFYKSAFRSLDSGGAVSFGASPDYTYTNNVAEFTYNLMVSCGGHITTNSEGGFKVVQTTNTLTHSNYIAGMAIHNYPAMDSSYFNATNGINGGDPLFVNEWLPLGPDGRPFTADDGLRLRPNSPARGIGALGTNSLLIPQSSFVALPSLTTNYYMAGTSNYNPSWHSAWAFDRSSWSWEYDLVPYSTNRIPFTHTFDATNSISGTWSTNDWVGNRDFVWDFGDGSRPIWTKWPSVKHTFLVTGETLVTLTITNSATNVSSFSRPIVLGLDGTFTNDIWYASTNGNDSTGDGSYGNPYLTATNVIHHAGPGDYICVLPGRYTNAHYDIGGQWGVNGWDTNKITFVGYNAVISIITNKVSYWTYEGFEIETGDLGDPLTAALIRTFSEKTNLTFRNLYVDATATNQDVFKFEPSGGVGNKGVQIYNCTILNVYCKDGWVTALANRDITITDNVLLNSQGQADFRVDSDGAVISRNYYYGHGYTNGAHADFIVWNGTPPVRNYTVEQNWFEMPPMSYQYSLAKTNVVVDFTGVPNNGDSVTINGYTRYFTNNTPASETEWVRVGANATGCKNNFYTNSLNYPWEAGWITKFSEAQGITAAVDVRGNVLQVMTTSDVGANLSSWLVYYHSMPSSIGNCGGEPGQNANTSYSNFVFRNNVMINVYNGWSPVASDGLKCYNNLFYRCSAPGQNVLIIGTRSAGSTFGTDIRNNIFFECGDGTNYGTYNNGTMNSPGGSGVATNGSLDFADYNFACWTNYQPKEHWMTGDPYSEFPELWAIPFIAQGAIDPGPVPLPRYDQQGQETNGINGVNPLFVSEGAYDFRLQSGSPLLAEGVDLSATGFNYDFFGRTRPASWAIGPFEQEGFTGEPEPPASVVSKVRLRGKATVRGKATLR